MNQDRSESAQLAEQAAMFGNRLHKNAKHRRKWAARTHTSCYRLYDRDIPEVPLAVDWYEGRAHVSHYPAREHEYEPAWLEAMVAEVTARLELERASVFVKERRRQKGADQYERVAASGARFVVSEGEARYWVNLADYVDTGLFLDHRVTRRLVAERAAARRVLNLFSYTASFSVAAAIAGAAETTSVDLSNTYSQWAQDNLELNGLAAATNRVVTSDVFDFLTRERTAGERYDVVVVDPPIFSNSKKTLATFDVQRDHGELLHAVATVCADNAEVFFSTSRRKFRFDDAGVRAVGLAGEEITAKTVPEDFRHRAPHRAYRLTRHEARE